LEKKALDYTGVLLYNTCEGIVSSHNLFVRKEVLISICLRLPERRGGWMTKKNQLSQTEGVSRPFGKQTNKRKYLKRANRAKVRDAKLRGLRHWAQARCDGSPAANISVILSNERRTK